MTSTPTWHPKKFGILLVGTAVSDGTTEVWASICSSKTADNTTPTVELYEGNKITPSNETQVIWLDEFKGDQFPGSKVHQDKSRNSKIRSYFSLPYILSLSTISAQASPSVPPSLLCPPASPPSPPPMDQSLSQALVDRYFEGHAMIDDEVRIVWITMTADGKRVPSLQIMIQAKKHAMMWDPPTDPRFSRCLM